MAQLIQFALRGVKNPIREDIFIYTARTQTNKQSCTQNTQHLHENKVNANMM